jgi:hypothetical protein
MNTWQMSRTPEIDREFCSYVLDGYKSNSVIHAILNVRAFMFAQATFQFQALGDGPNLNKRQLFGTSALGLLEVPWVNGSTAGLLVRMLQHADLSGNAYVYRPNPQRLQVLRPDWVEIVYLPEIPDPLAYMYWPGGRWSKADPIPLAADDVCHWAPTPDPLHPHKGISWLGAVLLELTADKSMSAHKLKFFENAAVPNMVVTVKEGLTDPQRNELTQVLRSRHEGLGNAYKTMLLEGGTDAKVVGADMQAMTFDTIQAAGENRIAAAAGTPGIIANLKEGLQAATYSNYQQAMRRFAEVTCEPLWQSVCPPLSGLITTPPNSRLWYDKRNIPALRADSLAEAEVQQRNALTVESLIRGGFEPLSARDAVMVNDMSKLTHTGLFSVQLQRPGTQQDAQSTASTTGRAVDASVEIDAEPNTNGRKALPAGAEQ